MSAIRDAFVGVVAAVRARFWTFAIASVTVGLLSVAVPPLLLSVVRKPVDFFTINPWLRLLPEYLASPEHSVWTKAGKLSNLALFWFSADSPYGGTEWGFAIDVRDVVRIAATSVLVGVYFVLWRERRAMVAACAVPAMVGERVTAGGRSANASADRSEPGVGHAPGRAGGVGGVAGGLAAVLGLSTAPCGVVGCGAPVLPVVGLAFTGLTSTTLKLLADVAFIGTTVVFLVLIAAVAHLAWRVGAERHHAPRAGASARFSAAPRR